MTNPHTVTGTIAEVTPSRDGRHWVTIHPRSGGTYAWQTADRTVGEGILADPRAAVGELVTVALSDEDDRPGGSQHIVSMTAVPDEPDGGMSWPSLGALVVVGVASGSLIFHWFSPLFGVA